MTAPTRLLVLIVVASVLAKEDERSEAKRDEGLRDKEEGPMAQGDRTLTKRDLAVGLGEYGSFGAQLGSHGDLPIGTGLGSFGGGAGGFGGHEHLKVVAVPQPYPVHVKEHEKVVVPVEKLVPYPVEKKVPYPVEKLVPYPVVKHVPVPVERHIPVHVPKPFPVKVPVYKHIHHYIITTKHHH